MEKTSQLIKCVVHVSRPWGWKAYFWMGIVGFISGGLVKPDTAALFVYGMSSYLATIFAVNNLFDRESDLENPRKNNPLNCGCPIWSVWAVLLNQLVFLLVFYLYGCFVALTVYLLGLVLGLMYSAPPFRLKGRAGWDVLSHTLYFGALPYMFGLFLSGGSLSGENVLAVVSLMFYSAFLQLRNLEKDVYFDRKFGDKTLFVLFPRFSYTLLVLSGLAAVAVAAFFTANLYVAFFSLIVSLLVGVKYGWERFVDSLVVMMVSLGAVL